MAQRGIGYLATVITLVVLPTALALAWYHLTGDPTIRPLGLTREALVRHTGGGAVAGIVAHVEWDAARAGGASARKMQEALENAFRAKGVEVRVMFSESASGTRVTYHVGASAIGPYPQARAADGINAAVGAYRMKVPPGP